MIKTVGNIIFDFGAVLLDWNPHYLFDPYFGSREKTDWFLQNICTPTWNAQMDKGKPFSEGVAEWVARYPEWEKEIRLYHSGWIRMMGDEIPGMYALECDLKAAGYRLFGLSNWSAETFRLVRDSRVFRILEGMVISGEEKLLKPEPEIYRLLLRRFQLRAEDCLFIDDSLPNVRGAMDVGIQAIPFTDAATLRKLLI